MSATSHNPAETIGWTGAYRPTVMGTRHMAVAGHYAAAHAALAILEAGGNAVDAGCAAGIALGVLKCDVVNVAGVAPIIVYEKKTNTAHTISGLGYWPKRADPELFRRDYDGLIPPGILRTVVPAAPEAWITALKRFGTMTFGDVASAAIAFAGEGFPTHPFLADMIHLYADEYRRWPSNAAIFLPGGRAPRVGEIFRNTDLARSLQYMVDEERAASARGRTAGLDAARDAFYRGDLSRTFVKFHEENGGWLREDDLSDFHVEIEDPPRIKWNGIDVFTCGPWCQGPVLLQALRLLEPETIRSLPHNSADYIHHLVEALKLSFSDREKYYGDPRFVDVPLEKLLSSDYAAERRRLIRHDEAWPGLPPPGDAGPGSHGPTPIPRDTSYVCVVDREGNAFSATPSDTTFDTPVIPGTGMCLSSRGSQSWTDPSHASVLAPGKRPRLTPAPALAIKENSWVMPFGTPGGDVQQQAMLQVFLNVTLWGMAPQVAVEVPRFATYSFQDSFQPHDYFPGRLSAESRISGEVRSNLASRGHDIVDWPDWTWRAGAVCTVLADMETGVLSAGADPRRPCYAVGW